MKYSLLALASLVAGVASAPSGGLWSAARLTADYSFAQYTQDFSKVYATPADKAHREGVFQKALAQALAHNADPRHSYKLAINQFSDRTPAEFRNSHGYDRVDRSFQFTPFQLPAGFQLSSLPVSVDWRTKNVVTPIKNQGMCGSCWAFSSTENIESYYALNTSTLVELSPQNLVSCDPNPNDCGGKGGCRGSVPELAFDYVTKSGLCSEADWPYVSGSTSVKESCNNTATPVAKVTGWTKLAENNYEQVMYALATYGPLAINVDAIPMQAYGGGLFTGCAQDATHIDHVIQLVGYGHDDNADQNYWVVRNSWGDTWGDAGYMNLLRHDPSEDWCSLDIYPADGTACNGNDTAVETCGSCGILYDVSFPTGAQPWKK